MSDQSQPNHYEDFLVWQTGMKLAKLGYSSPVSH